MDIIDNFYEVRERLFRDLRLWCLYNKFWVMCFVFVKCVVELIVVGVFVMFEVLVMLFFEKVKKVNGKKKFFDLKIKFVGSLLVGVELLLMGMKGMMINYLVVVVGVVFICVVIVIFVIKYSDLSD